MIFWFLFFHIIFYSSNAFSKACYSTEKICYGKCCTRCQKVYYEPHIHRNIFANAKLKRFVLVNRLIKYKHFEFIDFFMSHWNKQLHSFIQQFNNKGCLSWVKTSLNKKYYLKSLLSSCFITPCSYAHLIEYLNWFTFCIEFWIQPLKKRGLDKNIFGNVFCTTTICLHRSCSVIKTLSKSHLTIAKIDGHFPGQMILHRV